MKDCNERWEGGFSGVHLARDRDYHWASPSEREGKKVSPASAVRAAGQRSPRGAEGTSEGRPSLVERHLFLPFSLLLPD